MPTKLFRLAQAVTVATILSLTSSAAHAITYTYVGTWRVDAGPYQFHYPTAYTGQEVAALMFGGLPSDYAISTMGNNPAAIDFQAWYSVLGVRDGHKLDQDYDVSLPSGLYYDGVSPYDTTISGNPASAFVKDAAMGASYRNYAFRIELPPSPVPLPASLPMMAGGLGLLAFFRR